MFLQIYDTINDNPFETAMDQYEQSRLE